jgi:hypothetical protein
MQKADFAQLAGQLLHLIQREQIRADAQAGFTCLQQDGAARGALVLAFLQGGRAQISPFQAGAAKQAAAEAKEAERKEKAVKNSIGKVASTAAGTVGREVGNTIGSAVGGKFGKKLGGNLGASLARNIIGLLKK